MEAGKKNGAKVNLHEKGLKFQGQLKNNGWDWKPSSVVGENTSSQFVCLGVACEKWAPRARIKHVEM